MAGHTDNTFHDEKLSHIQVHMQFDGILAYVIGCHVVSSQIIIIRTTVCGIRATAHVPSLSSHSPFDVTF